MDNNPGTVKFYSQKPHSKASMFPIRSSVVHLPRACRNANSPDGLPASNEWLSSFSGLETLADFSADYHGERILI